MIDDLNCGTSCANLCSNLEEHEVIVVIDEFGNPQDVTQSARYSARHTWNSNTGIRGQPLSLNPEKPEFHHH